MMSHKSLGGPVEEATPVNESYESECGGRKRDRERGRETDRQTDREGQRRHKEGQNNKKTDTDG